jgi:hypothetical protein
MKGRNLAVNILIIARPIATNRLCPCGRKQISRGIERLRQSGQFILGFVVSARNLENGATVRLKTQMLSFCGA